MSLAYIAIGSNVGDRARSLYDAVRLLVDETAVPVRFSPIYETSPVGFLDQPDFLNAVVELQGELPTPEALLAICLGIEGRLGRARTMVNGPRTIDLDLLLYDAATIVSERLVIPHPRMHERRFVLEPLADLASSLVHPTLGRTIVDLLRGLEGVTPI